MSEKGVILLVVGFLLFPLVAALADAHAKGEAKAYRTALAVRREARQRLRKQRRERAALETAHRWTLRWARQYGPGVGRWASTALDVGWPEREMPTLGYVIWKESRGNSSAVNETTWCRGLLQIHPCHGEGWRKAFDPRENLKFGLRLWRSSGWRPWGL